MPKSKKCNCKDLERDCLFLTNHHQKCPLFNPASELHDMEQQCQMFMDTIIELKSKVREMQKLIDSVESI